MPLSDQSGRGFGSALSRSHRAAIALEIVQRGQEVKPAADMCACEDRTIRLLNDDHGFRLFCFTHAIEATARGKWRDACGDLFRARERKRGEMMMREFRR